MDLINVLATGAEICGKIPPGVFNVVSMIIMAIQVVVPILLIIWGMIDFTKAVIGQDENKIKDAQKIFIKRLIAAAIVFLTVTIVRFLVNVVVEIQNDDTSGNKAINDQTWSTCINQFINGYSGTTS